MNKFQKKKKKWEKNYEKNRKFTTFDFSNVETVRFCLELLKSAATTNLATFDKILFSKIYLVIVKRAIAKTGFSKFLHIFASKKRKNGDFYVKIVILTLKNMKFRKTDFCCRSFGFL